MPSGKGALAVFAQMLGTPPTALPELMGKLVTPDTGPAGVLLLHGPLLNEDGAFRFEG